MEDTLNFQLEVIILEAEGLKSVSDKRIVYCTIEVEGQTKLQTEHVEANHLMWNTQGDYTLSHPLPVVKLKMYAENPGMLALDDKELGKIVLKPTPLSSSNPEWHQMTVPKNSLDRDLKLKVVCRLESPQSVKHCGFLYTVGKIAWKKWKKRYHVMYEIADKMYALCSYKVKKAGGIETILLDGYMVDYIEPEKAKLMVGMALKGGNFFFSAVKEGDNVLLATDDEKECRSWVTALYKATGQSNKPVWPHSGGTRPEDNQMSGQGAIKSTPKVVKRNH